MIADSDGDGFTVAQGDCNNTNVAVHLGATQIFEGNGVGL